MLPRGIVGGEGKGERGSIFCITNCSSRCLWHGSNQSDCHRIDCVDGVRHELARFQMQHIRSLQIASNDFIEYHPAAGWLSAVEGMETL